MRISDWSSDVCSSDLERPLAFFSAGGAVLALAAVALAFPLLLTYLDTGLVPRLPTAVMVCALMILVFLSLAWGLVLDSLAHARRELKRLHYLTLPAPLPWTVPADATAGHRGTPAAAEGRAFGDGSIDSEERRIGRAHV